MLGSDGKEYMFLLKGHEDLRQVRGAGEGEGIRGSTAAAVALTGLAAAAAPPPPPPSPPPPPPPSEL